MICLDGVLSMGRRFDIVVVWCSEVAVVVWSFDYSWLFHLCYLSRCGFQRRSIHYFFDAYFIPFGFLWYVEMSQSPICRGYRLHATVVWHLVLSLEYAFLILLSLHYVHFYCLWPFKHIHLLYLKLLDPMCLDRDELNHEVLILSFFFPGISNLSYSRSLGVFSIVLLFQLMVLYRTSAGI